MSANVRPQVVARVRRGMALLDKHGPAYWRDCIDPKHLAIDSIYDCALGQIYGTYIEGLGRMPMSACMEPHEYGFTLPEVPTMRLSLLSGRILGTEWDELNTAWRQELSA